ncbi:MAG: hypothetical protein HOC23_09030 [Halieaceae bacterium]|jgi:hypothetical protein|nr:hypothetical protein [Halieaceae bacterium]
MDILDLLLVGVEVSIALAGFAGIIATYQINDRTMTRRGPVGALTVIVQFSLGVAMFCSICICLIAFEVVGKTLWAITSLIGAALYVSLAFGIVRMMRGAIVKKSVRFLFMLLQGIGALIAIGMILNSLNLVFHREPGPIVAGIIYALSVAAFMFSRLLLQPLWKAVREQEAKNSTVGSQG